MYNRYIQQPDGSFRKSRIDGSGGSAPMNPSPPEAIPESESQPGPDIPEQKRIPENPATSVPPPAHNPPPNIKGENLSGFLHQLLPKDFDTGDLIVVLLLLLLSENGKESPNTSLLTLVIYLFL